jgi:hypothetical protein
MAIYTQGADTYIVTRDSADPDTVMVQDATGKVEIWHDHRDSGSGCNNWAFDCDGDSFDLEFCRSLPA